MADGSLKEASVSGLKWSAIERFSVQGVQVLIEIVLARMLTPADYGLVAALGIFIALGHAFVDSGFTSALVRKTDCTEEDYSTTLIFNTVVSCVCYCVIFLLAPFVADFFEQEVLCDLLRVLAIILIVNSFGVVPRAIFTSAVDFKTQALASLVAVLASGVVSIWMAYNGYGAWALVGLSLSSALFSVVVLWWKSSWRPSLRFSRRSFRVLFGYGSKLLLSGLIATLYSHFATILIGKYFTKPDLGYYSRADRFAMYVSVNLSTIMQRVSFPVFSKIQDDTRHLMEVYKKYILLSSMVIFIVMMALAALSKPFILVVLGEQWGPTVPLLQMICFSLMFDHLNAINLNVLVVKGRSDLFLRLEIIKKAISFSMMIASVPFGVVGITLSRVVYCQVAIVINSYYTGKLYGLGYVEQFKAYMPFFLKAIVACVPAYLLTCTDLNKYVQLFAGGAACLGFYYLMLKNNASMKEAVSIVQTVLGKVRCGETK